MNEVRLKISSPWVTYINKVQALFDGDPEIACNITWDSAKPQIVLATHNGDKAAALLKLLPSEKKYGNVTLKIGVDGPISNRAFVKATELFNTAFEKNPAFAYCINPSDENYWFVDFTYVVFKNCVVQFFNDNLNDPHGLISTLYQDIAAELFEDMNFPNGNICYCTDVEHKVGVPLGEWP